jgi:hypothetical protein
MNWKAYLEEAGINNIEEGLAKKCLLFQLFTLKKLRLSKPGNGLIKES